MPVGVVYFPPARSNWRRSLLNRAFFPLALISRRISAPQQASGGEFRLLSEDLAVVGDLFYE